jgi:hypothetical protein
LRILTRNGRRGADFHMLAGRKAAVRAYWNRKRLLNWNWLPFGGAFPPWLYMATFWTWFQGKNWPDSRPSTMGVRLFTEQLSRACLLPFVAIDKSSQNRNRLWIRSAAGV